MNGCCCESHNFSSLYFVLCTLPVRELTKYKALRSNPLQISPGCDIAQRRREKLWPRVCRGLNVRQSCTTRRQQRRMTSHQEELRVSRSFSVPRKLLRPGPSESHLPEIDRRSLE